MSLESLGNLGEFVSGVAVVVSLVYLATQVRQHNRSVRSAALSSISASISEFLDHVARDPELTTLWFDGLSGTSELAEVDARRFHILLLSLVRRWENAYHQSSSADLRSEVWGGVQQGLVVVFSSPGAKRWWDNFGVRLLSKDFVSFATRALGAVEPAERSAASAPASGTG